MESFENMTEMCEGYHLVFLGTLIHRKKMKSIEKKNYDKMIPDLKSLNRLLNVLKTTL